MSIDYKNIVESQRRFFATGSTYSLEFRIKQLEILKMQNSSLILQNVSIMNQNKDEMLDEYDFSKGKTYTVTRQELDKIPSGAAPAKPPAATMKNVKKNLRKQKHLPIVGV